MATRLTDAEKERVRADNPLVDVLGRAGIHPPERWNGADDFMICCPTPGHSDSTPSAIVHPQTDRWHCFGCEAGGDVMQLVMDMEGVTSLAKAAEILGLDRPLTTPAGYSRVSATTAAAAYAERPELGRTSAERILASNAEAWRYLTLPALADRARSYLGGRGIDVTALEAEVGRPLAGHTPASPTGLVNHLQRRGFTAEELVDAGWATRRADGSMTDRYRHRVVIPCRDTGDRVIGVYGRDTTGRSTAKYLNTPETRVWRKGEAIYRPSTPVLHEQATVTVTEGALDALAIAARAADEGQSAYYAPVSPSGTALTAGHVSAVLAISDRPPLVCADGDDAGLRASAKWAVMLTERGRETLATVLPAKHDPASWMAAHGSFGLLAFTRKGCLDAPEGAIRPSPAGALLARVAMMDAALDGVPALDAAPGVVAALAAAARHLPSDSARERFSVAAGRELARAEVGTDTALARAVRVAIVATQGNHASINQAVPSVTQSSGVGR